MPAKAQKIILKPVVKNYDRLFYALTFIFVKSGFYTVCVFVIVQFRWPKRLLKLHYTESLYDYILI